MTGLPTPQPCVQLTSEIWWKAKSKHSSDVTQGCQMKISIKSQTMQKRGQKRPNRLFKGQQKSQTSFAVLPSLCHKKHLNYKNIKIFSSKVRLNLAWHCTGALLSFELVLLTTAWPHQISGQMLSSHSVVSSSSTVRPCSPWGGRWIGHWRTI